MSSDLLRQGAALMRERAEAAAGGEWEASEERGPLLSEWAIFSPDAGHDFAVVEDEGSAEHIASWHPAVALAVANLLDATADHADATGGHCVCDDAALGVARAYLGESS